ncbi:MAG: hypothetical protein FJ125_14150, partial [Deltaproteobacteria bacterium]|nr:hypothetical protein [Deltaproteobacteria bacterium]
MVRMSSHHCRLIAAGFAVLLGALAPCPRPLLAQSRAGACDRRAEQEAKAYHAKGKKLARAKKYAAAATELELAQRLCPNPVLVLNLAEVAEKTKDLALAAYQYHRYLTLAPQGKGAKKAEQALQRIDAELARTHSL